MSIRVTLLFVFVAVLAIYAWKDWFVSLCGLILLMAFIQHPDMPKNILGIQGLNPWNVLLAIVLCAWFVSRQRENLVWDLPQKIGIVFLLYLGVVVVGFVRMIVDREDLAVSFSYLISEYLINSIKWVIPGMLLFDGCRSQRRLLMAVVCLLFLYIFLAVQVIKWMPPRYAMTGASISRVANKLISNEIGYSRVNMSMMLSGASWAMLAALPLARRRWQRTALLVLFPAVVYAQALTGGRMGYITWGAIGLILCMLRWRKRLIFVPLVAIAIAIALPGVAERTFEGFGNSDVAGTESTDVYAVTAGRNLAWPRVVEKIEESPLVGFGRLAMERTGLAGQIQVEFNERFAHPHNAYLELLLDNGMVGFALVMPFYVLVVTRSIRLFLDRRDVACSAIGGITLCLVLAFLLASMGSQTFYPREGAVGMWAAIGLMLRVHLLRSGARVHPAPTPLTYGMAPPGTRVLAVSD